MDIEDIKERVRAGLFRFSVHAEMEAEAENLDISQIVGAMLASEILEQYQDTGRGQSCLLVGFSNETPIHIVCGQRGQHVVVVTVYTPGPPKFVDPWTRRNTE